MPWYVNYRFVDLLIKFSDPPCDGHEMPKIYPEPRWWVFCQPFQTPNGNVEAKVMCFYRRRDISSALVALADKHQCKLALPCVTLLQWNFCKVLVINFLTVKRIILHALNYLLQNFLDCEFIELSNVSAKGVEHDTLEYLRVNRSGHMSMFIIHCDHCPDSLQNFICLSTSKFFSTLLEVPTVYVNVADL